jgi:hypothetical protein
MIIRAQGSQTGGAVEREHKSKAHFRSKRLEAGFCAFKGGKRKMNEKPSKAEEKKMLFEYSKKYLLKKAILKKMAVILPTLLITGYLFTHCLKAKELNHENKAQAHQEDIKYQKIVKEKYEESKIKNQTEKEPQLVWKKEFGTKIFRFELHKEIDATDFPILAIATKDALIISDKKGNEKIRRPIPMLEFEEKRKKEKARGYAIVSGNGEYVLEGKGIPEFSYDLKYTTVDGRTLWEKKNFYGQEVVSPDGSTIVLLNTKGGKNEKASVEFYSESGKLLKQHFIDLSSIEMPLYALAFSEDGNYFVLRVEQWIEDTLGRRAIYPIILFDKKGNLLWQKNIEVTPGRTPMFELLISPHGNIISYSSDKLIYTVNKNGNFLWKKENCAILSFSDKGNLLLKAKKVLLVDGLLGTEIWSIDLGFFTIPHMASPKISPDESSIAILTTGETVRDKETLYVFNILKEKPKISFKKEFPAHFIRKSHFSTDSKVLYFVGQQETKLSIYRLVFAQ